MSIAAANLWTRSVYKAFLKPDATPAQEAAQSKLISLLVKFGALVFVIALPKDFAINLQLLGGIWILQTFPAIVIGLYTRWMHRWALFAGWAVGMAYGTWTAYLVPVVGQPGTHFGGSVATIPFTDVKVYIALTAFALNLLVAVGGTVLLNALKVPAGTDQTRADDYVADAGDPEVEDLPLEELTGEGAGARGHLT
jgi:SSS family solute:Na+ symporter